MVKKASQEIFTHDTLMPVGAKHVIRSKELLSLCHVTITIPLTPYTVLHAYHIAVPKGRHHLL